MRSLSSDGINAFLSSNIPFIWIDKFSFSSPTSYVFPHPFRSPLILLLNTHLCRALLLSNSFNIQHVQADFYNVMECLLQAAVQDGTVVQGKAPFSSAVVARVVCKGMNKAEQSIAQAKCDIAINSHQKTPSFALKHKPTRHLSCQKAQTIWPRCTLAHPVFHPFTYVRQTQSL